MANCILNTGYKLDRNTCWKKMSGVKKIFILPYFSNFTQGIYTNADGQIITLSLSDPTKYFIFDCVPETSNYLQKYSRDTKTGLITFDGKLDLLLHKCSAPASMILTQLINTKQLSIIYQDVNNKYWLLGQNFGCWLDTSEEMSGKKYGDFGGHKLMFSYLDKRGQQEILGNAFPASIVQTTTSGVPIAEYTPPIS